MLVLVAALYDVKMSSLSLKDKNLSQARVGWDKNSLKLLCCSSLSVLWVIFFFVFKLELKFLDPAD